MEMAQSNTEHEAEIYYFLVPIRIVKVMIGLRNPSAPPVIVMEYAANGSLKNYIHSNNKDVGPQYTWHLVIMHRDLKTDNVLLF
ncbi:hypothetical protein BV898_19465 [Hypsibius exemplaris]|uniref:Protein kinase domain-containing protein n=1 Tax=Hypsibius exemplaris TaxID=2072580 RepID=A0A9X6NJ05_HYPEX|nr:hypothetical protein BV898_19465 [Hypsibius exemplaris]